jgi:hypothetical protein
VTRWRTSLLALVVALALFWPLLLILAMIVGLV